MFDYVVLKLILLPNLSLARSGKKYPLISNLD